MFAGLFESNCRDKADFLLLIWHPAELFDERFAGRSCFLSISFRDLAQNFLRFVPFA